MTSPVPSCICSHPNTEHTDGLGRCHEPTGRCECLGYVELCAVCRHAETAHDGPNGVCTRIVQKTKLPCGCTQYPTEVTS
jgi:hypothetical protein